MGGSDRAQTTMYVSMRGSNAQAMLLYTGHTLHVSTAPPKVRSHQRQVQRQVCPMHSKPHIFMSTRTDLPRWHVQFCPLAVCSYPPCLAQQSCCKHVHCSCSSSCPTATACNGRYKQGRRGVHRDLVHLSTKIGGKRWSVWVGEYSTRGKKHWGLRTTGWCGLPRGVSRR